MLDLILPYSHVNQITHFENANVRLIHWGWVTRMCVSKLDNHLFTWGFVTCLALSTWNIVKWTLEDKLPWHYNMKSNKFIAENAFENVVCKMDATLSLSQCFKAQVWIQVLLWSQSIQTAKNRGETLPWTELTYSNHSKRLPFSAPMTTSSNGNIFRVTGHLCGEFTGPRWIPRTKASDAELWCFLWLASE